MIDSLLDPDGTRGEDTDTAQHPMRETDCVPASRSIQSEPSSQRTRSVVKLLVSTPRGQIEPREGSVYRVVWRAWTRRGHAPRPGASRRRTSAWRWSSPPTGPPRARRPVTPYGRRQACRFRRRIITVQCRLAHVQRRCRQWQVTVPISTDQSNQIRSPCGGQPTHDACVVNKGE